MPCRFDELPASGIRGRSALDPSPGFAGLAPAIWRPAIAPAVDPSPLTGAMRFRDIAIDAIKKVASLCSYARPTSDPVAAATVPLGRARATSPLRPVL